MNYARTLVLGAALVSTVARADAQGHPDEPSPMQESPPAPRPSTNTNGAPMPQPQSPGVVLPPDLPLRALEQSEPWNYETHDGWNGPIFTSGAVVFAGTLGVSALVAATSDHRAASRLYIPVVGPWLALNDWTPDCPINLDCDGEAGDKALLVVSGVLQATGVITMFVGVLSRTHTASYSRPVAKRDTKIHVTPTARGFAVLGHF